MHTKMRKFLKGFKKIVFFYEQYFNYNVNNGAF
jgi:hypothetical protein